MSEDIGSLVVKVAMDNSNFQQGVQNLNRSLRVVQSDFKATTASLGENGKGIDGLKAKSDMLSKSIGLQSEIVDKYKGKLNESKDTLEKNKNEHVKLKDKVDLAKKAFEESEKTLGKNSEETKTLKKEYENLNQEYVNSEEKIRNNVRAMDNWEVKTNSASAKLDNLKNDLNGVNQELVRSQDSWLSAGKSLEETSKKLDTVGKGVSGAGDKILKLSAPLIGIGVAGLKVSMDFESAMSEVQAISGATGNDLGLLENKAKEMGKATSKSATESAQALKYMALAGWDVETSIKGLEPVLRLSEAGNIDLARASDLVTDSMSSMELGVDQLTVYLDKVAKSQASANTSADQMLEAYVIAGGTFKNLNTDLDTSSALIGILANRGLKGAEAGNALSSTMVDLSGSTDKTKKIFKELGIEIYDQKGKYIGVEKVLESLGDKFAGMTEEQKNYYLAQLVGKTQIETMNKLLSGMGNEYNSLKGDISNADGALGEMAKTMQDNLQGEITKFKSQLEGVGLQLGTTLIPMARDFIGVVSEWTEKFANLDPKTQEMIVKTGLLTVGIGGLLSVGGRVVSGAGAIIGVAGKVATAIGGVTTATTGVSTAATVATGAGGVGGLAGIATGLGGVAIAAAPYLLVAGAIAGTGYAIHKALTEEAIPAVDLFADKVEGATDKVITQANAIEVANEITVTTISEGTKKAVGAYIELDDKARQTMDNLYITGTTITGEMVNDITSQYAQMGQQVNTQLEEDKKKEVDTLQKFFDKSNIMTQEEEAKLIESTNKYYTDKQNLTNEANARIEEILKAASEQKRSLSKSEKEEINKIQNEQRENAVNILSEQEVEAKVILERMKDYDGRITAEQASEHIKELNKSKDESIKAANEEYKETVAAIIRKRDESKTITAEQAEALINEAERQRKETINKAEETRDGAVSAMTNQNKELKNSVNLATGEILTKWDKLKNWWDNWKPGTKTFSTKHINEIVTKQTYEGSPRLKELPNLSPGAKPWENWTGNSNFEGGLSYVGERGRELIVYPGGGIDLTANSTELRNLPRGTKIFNNQDTERLLAGGEGKKIPGFAKGNTSLGSNYGVQNSLVASLVPELATPITLELEIDINKSKDNLLKDAKELANKMISEVETDLSVKPVINVSDDILKRNTLNALKQGEKARLDYSEFLGKLNADEIERSIKMLDNEYKANVTNINKKINALKDGDKKKNKVSIDNARKELSILKENNKETLSILKERNSEINELAKEDANVFNDRMNQYDEAIKRLGIGTKDLEQDLLNQNAIVILQEQRVKELTDKYSELIKKFGATSEESLKMKKALEQAKTEIINIGNSVNETTEKIKQSEINAINDVSSRIKTALNLRYDEQFKKQQDSIKSELEQLENWKNESLTRINNVYDSKIERINDVTNIQVKALQDEIKAIDDAEKAKDRNEKEKLDLEKINRLQEALEFEHNEFNKVEIQKEIDRVKAEREKRLQQELIEDKKESLNKQITDIQEKANREKEILQIRKNEEIERTNSIYEHEKETLNKTLQDYQDHYDRVTEKSQIRAEAEKMIIGENQDEIIELLHSYEDKYEKAGNSLGERLLEGMQPAIDSILSKIADINKAVNSSSSSSSSGGGGSWGKGLSEVGSDSYREKNPDMPSWLGGGKKTVENNITINSPKAVSHSEALKKAENTARKLAYGF